MKVLIVNDTSFDITSRSMTALVGQISKELKKNKALPKESIGKELTVVFLGKTAAKKLNWQYRQKDYPTDVLSFSTDDPASLGELVFCPEVIEVQAKENKKSFDQELALMMIHGILHLLGYDHETNKDDEREMMSLQNNIFEKIFIRP